MNLDKTIMALILASAFSAQAATINYAIDVTDTNNDSFVGVAQYDNGLDIFSSISGQLTYKDGVVANSFSGYDLTSFSGSTGSQVGNAFSFSIPGVVWADGAIDNINGGLLVLLLDNSPSMQATLLDPSSFIVDDFGMQYQLLAGSSMSAIPEPKLMALLAAGCLSLGLSRRKLKKANIE